MNKLDRDPENFKLLIGTATYNEVLNISEWWERVRASFPNADLLIIDDSSPDGTTLEITRLMRKDSRLRLITRPMKLGLGSAHRSLMVAALEGSYDVLVTMDADLSHQPEEVPALVAKLRDSNFVIGTRHGEGTLGYRGVRRFLSVGGNFTAKKLIPTGLSEYTTSLRAFDRTALEVLLTEGTSEDGYAFFLETVVTLYRAKLNLREVPITFTDRTRGKSKIPRNQIWMSSITLVRLTTQRAFDSVRKESRNGFKRK